MSSNPDRTTPDSSPPRGKADSLGILGLDELSPATDGRFGGKASGLAALVAAAARVPDGFAVEITGREPDAWTDSERDAFRTRTRRLLDAGPIAVRSSAAVEDGARRSFAGLFETVLGVGSVDAALAAAARCIAAGRSERVRAAAAAPGGAPGGAPAPASAGVGLVCQVQVEAVAAGVCFTWEPDAVGGWIVVEAVRGAGEALVAGREQPERWRAVRGGGGGGPGPPARERSVEPGPILDAAAVELIAVEAARLASRLGRALDLEWAIDAAGRLWWLQARPITVAMPHLGLIVERSIDGLDDGPVTVWSNFNVRETMPDPLSPLCWSVWRDSIAVLMPRVFLGLDARDPVARDITPFDRIQGRIYWNLNALMALPLGSWVVLGMGWVDEDVARVMPGLLAQGVPRARRLSVSRPRFLATVIASRLRAMARALVRDPDRELDRLASFGLEAAARRDQPLAALPDGALVERIEWVGALDMAPLDCIDLWIPAAIGYIAASWLFRKHSRVVGMLTAGLRKNPTTQVSVAIDRLVRSARPIADRFMDPVPASELLARLASDPAAANWLEALSRFLVRHGHRCPGEFDLATPRWDEDPEMIIGLVRAGLAAPPGEGLEERLVRLERERRRTIESAVRASPRWIRPAMRIAARAVERYMPLREAPKHYYMIVFHAARRAALELGSRWTARGVLERREDIFLMELSEVVRLGRDGGPWPELPGVLAGRRARHAAFARTRVPVFVRSDGLPVEVPEPVLRVPVEAGALAGVGVSAGRAAGPVRVLTRPDPAAMRDGDVLVVSYADPGWTPLFPRAAALVMEVGGLMCHAAIVARELGIPGVFGVPGATRLLADGERVTVDGDRGLVLPGAGVVAQDPRADVP
jgi:pyruvate,water dikinase